METLKELTAETLTSLFQSATEYLSENFAVLREIPFQHRKHFTAIVKYLRHKSYSESLSEIEKEKWPEDLRQVVIDALQSYTSEHNIIKDTKYLKDFHWKIDVALSTNSLSKVLRPEIQLQFDNSEDSANFHMTISQFQELRRQTASVIKDLLYLNQFNFIKNSSS